MSKFSELQATHEALVEQAQTEDVLAQARQYLKDVQSGSSQVSLARERDQLRANLRYWAGYVYEKTKEYPNVDLLPATADSSRRTVFPLVGGGLLLLLFFALGYFVSLHLSANTSSTLPTEASILATFTPLSNVSATSAVNQRALVQLFNDTLHSIDPLGDVLDARFTVLDVGFGLSGTPAVNTMQVQVDCEAISTTSSCSSERAFVLVARVLENESIRQQVSTKMPTPIQVLQVQAFDHLTAIGALEVNWRDFMSFASGNLTAAQLALRVVRYNP